MARRAAAAGAAGQGCAAVPVRRVRGGTGLGYPTPGRRAGAGDKVARRYPFAACEVLCCEVDAIFGALLEDAALMARLFGFLDGAGPLDCARAGFFARAVTCLLMRRHADVMRHLQAAPAVLERLVAHVDTTSIAEARAPPVFFFFLCLFDSFWGSFFCTPCVTIILWAWGHKMGAVLGGWTPVRVQQRVHCCGRWNLRGDGFYSKLVLAARPVTPRRPRRGPATRTQAQRGRARAGDGAPGGRRRADGHVPVARAVLLALRHQRGRGARPCRTRQAGPGRAPAAVSRCSRVALSPKAYPLSSRLEARPLRAASCGSSSPWGSSGWVTCARG